MREKLTGWMVAVLLLLTVSAAAAQADPVAAQIEVGGKLRNYWTYVPAGINRTQPVPLLLVLHGSAGSGGDMMAVTQRGYERIADKDKFVVVYPDALERRWNEQNGDADDVGFLLAIIDNLAADSIIDIKRVAVAGISNGGMMAQRLACEYPDRVAVIATVAGSMPEGLAGRCKPSKAVPVMVIHGTQDPIVPWEGGPVAGFEDFGKVLSVRGTVAFWVANNRCRTNPVTSKEPDGDPADGTQVRKELFLDCADQKEVALVSVEGGGHTWPGGFQYLPERFIGKTSKDVDANQLTWEFFRRNFR